MFGDAGKGAPSVCSSSGVRESDRARFWQRNDAEPLLSAWESVWACEQRRLLHRRLPAARPADPCAAEACRTRIAGLGSPPHAVRSQPSQ